jgi:hypothetical protein
MKEQMSKFECNEPASESAIKKVEELINITFPEEYYDFLLISNGGEGPVGEEAYLALWKVEDLIKLNDDYGVEELLIIGSDGGDTAYCIDRRGEMQSFVEVPFIVMDLDEVEHCSNDFKGFIQFLSNEI